MIKSKQIKRFLFFTLLFVSFIVSAQNRIINGVVKDNLGFPIGGATINIKGTETSTISDLDGNFKISVNKDSNELIISFVGMKSKTIQINGKSKINIELDDEVNALNEVVVLGYGSQRKKDLTGAVAIIKSDDLKNRTNTQIGALLQGQATGVQVLNSSGKPSQGLSIRIRGTSSVGASSEPLYVVDGVPTTDTRSINPADVEAITILKDASSAAIYGAGGANGVVIITTKKGTSSKPRVTFESYTGVSQVWRTLKVLNGEQYRDLMGELGLNTNWNLYNKNTDWQREIFQDGLSQNYQASISGKSGDTNYYFSGGYLAQSGAVRSAELKRFNYKINLDQKINEWLSAGARIAYTKYNDVDIKDNQNVNSGGVLLGALTTPSVIGIFNPDGSFTSNPFQNWENPIASTDGLDRGFRSSRVLANFFFNVKITKDLTLKTNYGIDNSDGTYEQFLDPDRTGFGRAIKGQAIKSINQTNYWIFDNTLTFAKSIKKHRIEVLAGTVMQKFQFDSSNLETRNFTGSTIRTLNGGSEIFAASSNKAERSNTAAIARLNYGFDDKYLIAANFRADASSVFGPNKRMGYFPSVSLGWKISNEKFLANNKTINNLKLRASYGIVGNDQIGNYAYLGRIGAGANYPIGGVIQPGTYPATLQNNDLKWEETTQKNIGIDLELFQGRIKLTADAYIKDTKDLLFDTPLPTTSGFDRATLNIGTLENKGYEFGLKTINSKKGIKWESAFNLSFNRNKITSMPTPQLLLGDIAGRGQATIIKEGLPLGTLYGYEFGGVDPATGNAYYLDKNGVATFTPSDTDRKIIGDANPDFIYSVNNTFSYKGFNLQIFLEGSYGNDMLNATRIDTEGMIDPKNQSIDVINRWRQPGDITNIPRSSFGNTDNSRISTRFIEDASYMRFKAVTLSYDFSESTAKKMLMENFRVYVTGENLLTITKYSGFDPEVNAFGGNNSIRGVDFGTYPQSRTIIFGINVSF